MGTPPMLLAGGAAPNASLPSATASSGRSQRMKDIQEGLAMRLSEGPLAVSNLGRLQRLKDIQQGLAMRMSAGPLPYAPNHPPSSSAPPRLDREQQVGEGLVTRKDIGLEGLPAGSESNRPSPKRPSSSAPEAEPIAKRAKLVDSSCSGTDRQHLVPLKPHPSTAPQTIVTGTRTRSASSRKVLSGKVRKPCSFRSEV